MAPTCFGPSGPSSGSMQRNLAKVNSYCRDHQLKYIVKIVVQWQYMECALGAVRRVTAVTRRIVYATLSTLSTKIWL